MSRLYVNVMVLSLMILSSFVIFLGVSIGVCCPGQEGLFSPIPIQVLTKTFDGPTPPIYFITGSVYSN